MQWHANEYFNTAVPANRPEKLMSLLPGLSFCRSRFPRFCQDICCYDRSDVYCGFSGAQTINLLAPKAVLWGQHGQT